MKEIVLFLMLFTLTPVFSQSESVKNKINEIENNLIPFVPIKGFKSWNIFDRMKYYNVSGVSVAVIKDYKIVWAKDDGLNECFNLRLI
ncbi:MAG TPA: hypothetical protein PLY70_04615 [Saprospiraceae bacterium]|nr:hypothetical protein [Saprospiraceae bacterium]HPN69536.1 hypothetical protein [Saprospiraceae bacterium]